ncbi:hypothetical protein RB195_004539 [Necator americanus]|uniref:Uncharacterized protein n=1 Tax=Necator americanus TaxID=51031 RepID=A0ABR1BLY6_NECAM
MVIMRDYVKSCGLVLTIRFNNDEDLFSAPKSLSSRYQTLENLFITQFATYLSLLQVTIYVLYSLGGLGMRTARYALFGDDEIAFGAARGIFYLIPLFTFLLPLLTIYLLRKHHTERESSINFIITMKSTGMAGAQNYHDVITRAWLE